MPILPCCRRVLAEASHGRSFREIADGLNRERVPHQKLIRAHDARAVRSRYEALATDVVVTIGAADKDGVVHTWRAAEAA